MIRSLNRKFTLYERTVIAVMVSLVAGSSAVYLAYLVRTIAVTSERDAIERRIDQERGQVAEAERTYATLVRSITSDFAVREGYRDARSPVYLVSSASDSGAFTLRDR